MKKKCLTLIAIIMMFLCCFPVNIHASDSGYYYESINVNVDVNSKREMRITETLDVYFEEAMHGIIRNIPNSSSTEGYEIEDVSVEGANYQVEDSYNGVDIRIGDADRTVKGKQRYIVSYTLKHYQDIDVNHDYIYINLIGDDFDSPTKKLTARINWPENGIMENVTCTSGYSGSTQNSKLKYETENNTMFIESIEALEAYEAATVKIQFVQGVFSDAPEYVYPYIVEDKNIDIVVDSEQNFHVTQKMNIQTNGYASYPINPDFDMMERVDIQDLRCVVNGVSEDYERYIYFNEEGNYEVEISYTIHPRKIMNGEIVFSLVDHYEDTKTNYLNFQIQMPKVENTNIRLGRYNDVTDRNRYNVRFTEDTFTFDVKDVQTREYVELSFNLMKKDYYRPTPILINIIPVLSIVLFVICLIMRFFVVRNHFVEPVSFYPPKGMNSAEVGYLIDRKCSDEDMTSLIFYWASLGCLKIKGIDKKFSLIKVKDLPSTRPSYERMMFNEMFSYGKDNEVTAKNLKNKFYIDINIARKEIIRIYKKDKPLYDSSVNKYKYMLIIFALVMILGMVFAISESDSTFGAFGFIMKIMMMSPTLIFAFIMLAVSKIITKNSVNHALNIMLYTLFLLPVFIMSLVQIIITDNYLIQYLIVIISNVLTVIFALGIKKYNESSARLIGELRGFKTFLKEAEKEQLEMLLEENPEYYYAILPFAQSLHVTKIWQNKFKEITIEPPTYHEGDRMTYAAFNSLTRTISHSMVRSMASPASSSSSSSSSSSGGGFGGGGSSFSGGGSSGGGSGGGGSRGW